MKIRICTVAARRHLVASQHPYSFVPVQAEQKDSLFPKSLTQLRLNECGLQDSFSEKGKVKSTLENQGNQNLGLFLFYLLRIYPLPVPITVRKILLSLKHKTSLKSRGCQE